ncbi:threonine/homoserine/homoserine lactone efflux protein [Actimicrobium sp. GrIS 1.19]|uniref:LysE family translocator n=1 Tax=Actimicrobium sp. GrIS 1.19 TaxID=3071708 RepID=UPI002E02246C|nr:threonine/homoserine/homoserine lactone efflux protein [Actimicrobium sp. GrIS 1.19]
MEPLIPLAMFAFVSSITPGPNNIMLTSSGIRFGFRRSVPHLLGITFGFGVMLLVCALGVGALILAVPALHLGMKIAGSGYLIYLAWQLRRIAFKQSVVTDQRPMTFFAAALFQAANPKAWVMAVTGVAAFLPTVQPVALAIGLFCLVFCAINLPCVSVWLAGGSALRHYLTQPKWQRLFCIVMVVLTLYSAAAIWL